MRDVRLGQFLAEFLAEFRQNVARFRLYRQRFLQENTRFAAFFKIFSVFRPLSANIRKEPRGLRLARLLLSDIFRPPSHSLEIS